MAAARDALLRAHYDEFRKVAGRVLNGDAAALQIQPTDLAHEAVIRLSGLDRLDFKGRTHFLSLSARVMRQILIDEIRRMRARKRQAPPVVTRWVDHAADETTLVFCEHSSSAPELPGGPYIAFAYESGVSAGVELIEEIGSAVKATSTKFSVGSFDPMHPNFKVSAEEGEGPFVRGASACAHGDLAVAPVGSTWQALVANTQALLAEPLDVRLYTLA